MSANNSSPRQNSANISQRLCREMLSQWSGAVQQNSDSTSHATWKQIVDAATNASSQVRSDADLRDVVNALCHRFPQLPSSEPPSEISSWLNSSATNSSTPRRPIHHALDKTAKDSLSPRGASMFPPLQKLTPRSSSSHAKFGTSTSEQLLSEERRIAATRAAHQPYFAHHFGKANVESERRARNTAAIQHALSQVSDSDDDSGSGRKRHFTIQQLESVQKQTTRFGLHFTSPTQDAAAQNHEGAEIKESAARLLLMTDQLIDKLRERERQKKTRETLDKESKAKQKVRDENQAQRRKEIEAERAAADEIAAETVSARKKALEHRAVMRAASSELRNAERERERQHAKAQEEKERYAQLAREENELQQALLQRVEARKRKKREETSKMNLQLASARSERRAAERAREQLLERAELAATSLDKK